jgi:hypothetical protein
MKCGLDEGVVYGVPGLAQPAGYREMYVSWHVGPCTAPLLPVISTATSSLALSLNFTTPDGADTLLYTATHSRINAYTRSLRQTFQDRGRKHFTILALLSPATHSLNAPPTGQKANAASLPYHSDGQILHLTALFIV